MRVLVAWSLLSWSVLAMGQTGNARFEDLSAKATAARNSQDIARAIDLYKQAVEVNPKWAEGWWFLGTLLYDGDHFAEGRDALAHLLALEPNTAPALQILGLCEFETGDYEQALKHIERGTAATPPAEQMEAVLRFHKAMLLTRTARFDKALTEYVWFARKGVRNPELITGIGLAALRNPLLPRECPASERNLYDDAGRAAYLSLSGDFTGARTALADLVRQHPDAHYVHYLNGCFLLAVEPDAGTEELQRELKITPGSGAANAMLAWVLLRRGDASAALPYAKAAAEREAKASLAQYVFGRALLEKGDVAGAIEHLQLAKEIDPSDLDTHMSLATAYSQAGHAAEARRERTQTLALWEGNAASANR